MKETAFRGIIEIGDSMKTIKDFDINNKTVILRCDLNVTIKDNKIIDDTRIKESIETINYILDNNAKLIIMSHLGKIKTEEDKIINNMEIVYKRLNELLPDKIFFIDSTNYLEIREKLNDIDYGNGLLIQNTRYEDLEGNKESSCDMELAKNWASMGEIFINDAFGTIHRKHASNYGISCYMSSGIGFLIEKELDNLNILDNPEKPFVVIMGGAKVSDKVEVINSLIKKTDYILIGGAMANTFLKAKGYDLGDSLIEDSSINTCLDLINKYGNKIVLPIDFNGLEDESFSNTDISSIKQGFSAMDIGDKTINEFIDILSSSKTVFWNGPLGMYEDDRFREGTRKVLEYIKDNIDTVILGGGDIVAASNILKYTKDVTFASTGGGATLSYICDHDQPGIINMK